jgi:uncharacterized membrane protein
MRHARLTYGVIAVGAGLWCVLLIGPSLLTAAGWGESPFVGGIYQTFHPICHQLDDRSLHLFGCKCAVCLRCSAVYFGFFAGVLLYPWVRQLSRPVAPGRWFVIAASLPMLLDVGAIWVGLHEGSTVLRLATGGWFGLLAPFLIIPGAIEGISQLVAKADNPPPPVQKG